MLQYLNNILPRLKLHGQALDRKELFSDQPWVIVDEELNKQQIIFKRDGRLLMSHNGQGFEGKWEYLPEVNGLWIDRGFDKLLLNQGFFLDGVMVLKKDGLKEDPVFFANPNKVPDLDVEAYLDQVFLKKPSTVSIGNRIVIIPLENDQDMVVFDCTSFDTIHHNKVLINEQVPLSAEYKVKDKNTFIVVNDGLIERVYHLKKYPVDDGRILQVEQFREGFISSGDPCLIDDAVPKNGTYKLNSTSYKWVSITNGRIDSFYGRGSADYHPMFFIILVFVILFIILMAVQSIHN